MTFGCVFKSLSFLRAASPYLVSYLVRVCLSRAALRVFSCLKLSFMFYLSSFFFLKLVIYLLVGDLRASLISRFRFYLQVSARIFLPDFYNTGLAFSLDLAF